MTDTSVSRRMPLWLPSVTHTLLRVVTGALFMQHGVQKLFGLLVDPSRPWDGPPALFAVGAGPFSVDAVLRGRQGRLSPKP